MRKYFRQAGYFAAILILLPYVVTILLNGRSSLAQDNGTSPYVTVKSDKDELDALSTEIPIIMVRS